MNAFKPAVLDMPSACSFVSLSESVLQQLVREGSFPKTRLLSARRVGWLVSELEAWAEALPFSDLPPPPNTGAKKGVAA